MAKKERRARKKARRALKLRCEECGELAPQGEDHRSAISCGRVAWDGFVTTSWCRFCGWEFCS